MKTCAICENIHRYFNDEKMFKRKHFTIDEINSIPYENGIYIVFEDSEKEAHNLPKIDRIVRIGTHSKPNNLKKRLHAHRVDSGVSVFRYKIGCAIMNEEKYKISDIKHWYKGKHNSISNGKKDEIRKKVSERMKDMTFVTFPVKNIKKKDKGNLFWEAKLISTIAHCCKCQQSPAWLGNKVPEKFKKLELIKEYGLWLTDEINSPVMAEEDFFELKEMINKNIKARKLSLPI